MPVPDRVSVPTCFGCGAMSRLGSCERGCSEHRLELVRGAAHDSLTALGAAACVSADAFAPIAARIASLDAGDQDPEPLLRALKLDARAALQAHPAVSSEIDPEQPLEVAVTWWCPSCGGIDAPQPCLGICIWKPVEWVSLEMHKQERDRILVEIERERRLRSLLRRIVAITPRPGQWARTAAVLQAEAAAIEPAPRPRC